MKAKTRTSKQMASIVSIVISSILLKQLSIQLPTRSERRLEKNFRQNQAQEEAILSLWFSARTSPLTWAATALAKANLADTSQTASSPLQNWPSYLDQAPKQSEPQRIKHSKTSINHKHIKINKNWTERAPLESTKILTTSWLVRRYTTPLQRKKRILLSIWKKVWPNIGGAGLAFCRSIRMKIVKVHCLRFKMMNWNRHRGIWISILRRFLDKTKMS